MKADMKKSTKSVTRVGYLPKKEKINATWEYIGLKKLDRFVLSKKESEDVSYSIKNYQVLKDDARKVRVTVTLTIEELQ